MERVDSDIYKIKQVRSMTSLAVPSNFPDVIPPRFCELTPLHYSRQLAARTSYFRGAIQLHRMMLSRSGTLNRALSKHLLELTSSSRSRTPAPLFSSPFSRYQQSPQTSRFSTMSALKAQADYALHKPTASVVGRRAYDPEITDMASYVHNHKIDSDLAVNPLLPHELG